MWRSTSETALFVSDVVLPAAQSAKAIRDHWSIRTALTTSATVASQKTPAASDATPGILARLRLFAANILCFNGVHNVTDGRHRIAFGGIRAILAMRVIVLSVEQPGVQPGLFNALFFGGMGRVSLKCHTPTQTAL